jgi:DNA-binding transcriptional LysR family regulator
VSTLETISFADLRCFLAIARNGSITKAGAELGVQKAAVSKALARLEQELGVKLFERSTRRLAITPAGSVLVDRAESLVSDVVALRQELQRDDREVGGTLTVAAPPELGVELTKRSFASYLEAYPRARLRLKLDYGFQDLFDPAIDLAFRIGDVKDESLVARPIWSFRRILVASPAFLARTSVRSPKDLSKVQCLGFDERSFDSSWSLNDGSALSAVDVEGRFAARSYPAILAAAEAGMGVAFLPEFVVARALDARQLARVLPRWSSPPAKVFLLYRPGHSRVRRVSAFVEHLANSRELPLGLRSLGER